ncbi:alpha/beta fold hydrolase [Nitrogeniibacter mangrovi]|uniref:Alpha/beta fold hydrolase n=1 Tax=Nitrogeniibacter mangrovi TaxID=2016596 RepID=A0A6C1AZN8_9RHOO|nr:alpha/beta hydrolase [Nitrogeniibacter mangrovi]QID16826.1 alpha/beta fold hydrolase [Nitrogeniibacter mangrovi]
MNDMIDIRGAMLEVAHWPSDAPRGDAPPILMLHEGLGSLGLWRDFPQRVAEASGCDVYAYSRIGYGRSDPFRAPRTPAYLHEQAQVDLPAVVAALGLERPVLFGHSDGGSIALIAAGSTDLALAGVVVMAPHVRVEAVTLRGIEAAARQWACSDWPQRLARHHRDAPAVFAAWRDTWLAPDFRDWNIEHLLPAIACPVLAIQGEDDEYGTMAQIDRIAAAAPEARLLKLPGCGHVPHRDCPDQVLDAVAGFVATL